MMAALPFPARLPAIVITCRIIGNPDFMAALGEALAGLVRSIAAPITPRKSLRGS